MMISGGYRARICEEPKELKREEKRREREYRDEEREIKAESKRSKKEKRKIRTGGFVDEIDEDDLDTGRGNAAESCTECYKRSA